MSEVSIFVNIYKNWIMVHINLLKHTIHKLRVFIGLKVQKSPHISLGLTLKHFVLRKKGLGEIQRRGGVSKYCYETSGAKSGATS